MAIVLAKGQRISLSKEAPGLTKIMMGLGWDPVVEKTGWFGKGTAKDIDLDASCIVFDENGRVIDKVSFRQLRSRNGAIQHSGDNLTGKGDGDDEKIAVDLNALPAEAKALIFTVCSFRGQTFNEVESASCRLVDTVSGREIAKMALTDKGNRTAAIMASVYRNNGEWKMTSIAELADGRVVDDLVSAAQRYV